MSKYYAVKKGKKTGIYTTWNDCQLQVNGFSGAKFKSFKHYDEALSYLNDNSNNQKIDENSSIIYTDGSCINKKGGFAVVDVHNNNIKYGPVPDNVCTNNIAELYAIYQALIDKIGCKITLYTDSNYSLSCLTKWANDWQKNGWKTSNNKDVANKKLIEDILHLIKLNNVSIFHVYGHSGNKYNEIADKYANIGRVSSNTFEITSNIL